VDDELARGLVGFSPELDRFLREQAVGEGDQEQAARLEHPGDFGEHLERPGQIVHRGGIEDYVEAGVAEWQYRLLIEVVEQVPIQALVLLQLRFAETEADQLCRL